MAELICTSVTHYVPVPDAADGRRWYARLFGREPDLVPAPGVYEWKLRAGVWLQVGEGVVAGQPSGQQLRLGVIGLQTAVDAFAALGGELLERIEIPGLITIQELQDPFGNRLSFYEEADSTPADQPEL